MKTKIQATNISKIFGDTPDIALQLIRQGRTKEQIFEATGQSVGVRDASFEVREGEIFVVMGLSGSGKSTLIRMINGLIKPTAGTMLVDGVDVATCTPDELRRVRREKVAMVFQHFALLPHKTVLDNVAFGLKLRGVERAQREEMARNALGQVGLAARADGYPDELSGGMQQRVGLARGLAAGSNILLMDEPFSALDPLIRGDMQQELIELQRTLNKTIVFITHDLNEALALGNTISIMRNGSIVQTGTAMDIVGRPADDYVRAFTRDIDRSRVFDASSIATPAEALDAEADDASRAMTRMEELGLDAIHVRRGNRIAGILTYRAASACHRDGLDWQTAIEVDYPQAPADTSLFDLYPLAEEGVPIALMDPAQGFVGTVQPHAVFRQLNGGRV